ncbi:MAG: hypothetical protein P4M15_12485 [Alphaproteobacteria bacterium]|nr:hypothetical protein [Alphaproteobacteria bacterium]
MASDLKLMFKAFAPRIMVQALTLLDKSTAIVIGVSWMAAIVILILAVISVHNATAAKKEAAEAVVAEPVLPVAVRSTISVPEAQDLVARLHLQFPDIKIDLDRGESISLSSNEGAKFHQWLAAVSYIDAMEPQYHWAIRDLCVGHCERMLMFAALTGEKIEYRPPPPKN